jgi:hypothetical protein
MDAAWFDRDLPSRSLPLTADPWLIHHAVLMQKIITAQFFPDHQGLAKVRLYHEHMADLVEKGHLYAVDLTIDIAYLTPDDPAVWPGLVVMTPDELRTRIHDLLSIRGRILN